MMVNYWPCFVETSRYRTELTAQLHLGMLVTVERKDHSWSQLIDVYLVQVYKIGLEWTPVGALQFAFISYNNTVGGWHRPSATRCWGGLGVLLATPQVDWAPFKLQPEGSTHFAIFEAQMVLFMGQWLGRQQIRTTAFQERYSSHLCGIFF